ncbi:hypothetical protein NHX12_030320 [Muraenolepis orangiensis]|uniref:Parathyroid hormone 4-like n=1 Tax=Muraenolepis orangiensis TaxID=630683 RepID=A0A9Q0EBI1_9TELE|nr:hypothetical protein NHX12_030320 [Muraenolepis orangiensis]
MTPVTDGDNKMWLRRKPVQFLAVIVLALVTVGQSTSQEDKSRRSVTEHQLMHDRGHSIQSLKRLIWLSSAMQGLHTAQTRSALFSPLKALNLGLSPGPVTGMVESPQSAGVNSQYRPAMDDLLRDFFNNNLTPLPEREP